MDWYLAVIKKYAVFSGRAQRKEFWMFFLINAVIQCAILGVERTFGIALFGIKEPVFHLYLIVLWLPLMAVLVRRLHDVGQSGWYGFIFLIPVLGLILLLWELAQSGIVGENQYGPDPKGEKAEGDISGTPMTE